MLTSFGQLLKRLRQDRQRTQVSLANVIGCNASYIARLEGGERHPSRHVVMGLAAALGVTDIERDELLAAAKHLPEGDLQRMLEQGGVNLVNPTIVAVASALQDTDLDARSRDLLAEEIRDYVLFRMTQIKQDGVSYVA